MSATYLLSSLPTLEFGVAPPFSVSDLRKTCEGIDGIDLGDFDAVEAGVPGSDKFTHDYANVLLEIKNITAAWRASKWEGENIRIQERSYLGCHVDLRQKISEALNAQNPYVREEMLEKARWQIADELAGMEYFSVGRIYAYIIKLQINCRIAALNDKAGHTAIEQFIQDNDRSVALKQ